MTTQQMAALIEGYVEREPNRIVSGEVLFLCIEKSALLQQDALELIGGCNQYPPNTR